MHPLPALAFGEPTGQGWTQVGELVIAFVLSLLVGLEREAQQKSAGMRTYSLVGLGSALFVLISKYGFSDVLREGVVLDPARVAAQIVSGLGFIGAGLIFVRRDAVRGLTTAASVWFTAAVGAAAGAGLPVLAALSTGLYFVVMYALRPLARFAGRFRPDVFGLRVTYLDGRGVLREVVNEATQHGFSIEELTTVQAGSVAHEREGANRDEADGAPSEQSHPTVEVTLVLAGRGNLPGLTATLGDVDGVLGVRTVNPRTEE